MLEEDLVSRVKQFLELNGFQTAREVIPNECKEWVEPYRVDLIFFRKDTGYVGVEFKIVNSWRNKKQFDEAIKQIKKYRNLHFFQENVKIERWCICAKENNETQYDNELKLFLELFLQKDHEIDLLEFLDSPTAPQWTRIIINGKKIIEIGNKREDLADFI